MKPWLKLLLIALGVMVAVAAWKAYSTGKTLSDAIKAGCLYPLRVPLAILALGKRLLTGQAVTGSGLSEIADNVLRQGVTEGTLNVTAGEGGVLTYTERNNPAPEGVEIVPGSYASTLFTI